MKVKLIQITKNPIDVMWTAARTCYSEKSPIKIWKDLGSIEPLEIVAEEEFQDYYRRKQKRIDKHWNLVKKVLDSGHQSIAEHVYFTFAIEGISRACSHQLVRHRAGIVYSQQSQRYVKIKEDYEYLSELNLELYGDLNSEDLNMSDGELDKYCEEKQKELIELLNNYFVGVNEDNCKDYLDDLLSYTYNVHEQFGNMKAEDARMGLPNATKTNITMSLNYRELIHICNLRLCTRAQKEIRDLFGLIVKEVKNVDERLASYLVPQCEVHGICFEEKTCRRKPSITEIMNTYKVVKNDMDDVLSETDWDILMDSIKNPKVNENLTRLMEMESVLE